MLSEYSKFQSSTWTGIDSRPPMVPTWSQNGPERVLKSRHSLHMFVKPYSLSLQSFRALAGLEVKLDQTRFQHGPNMALTQSQIIQHYKVLFC